MHSDDEDHELSDQLQNRTQEEELAARSPVAAPSRSFSGSQRTFGLRDFGSPSPTLMQSQLSPSGIGGDVAMITVPMSPGALGAAGASLDGASTLTLQVNANTNANANISGTAMSIAAKRTQYKILRTALLCLCCCPLMFFGLVTMLGTAPLIYSHLMANYGAIETWNTRPVHGVLPNGMKYVILNNPGSEEQSGRFSAYLQVDTGSANEQDSRELGIAHGCEHMAFDNSVEMTGRGGVWRSIEDAQVPLFNAFTSFRNTVYMLLDAYQNKIDRVFDIFYNQVQLRTPVQKFLDTEKGAVLGEARYSNDSSMMALERMLFNHGGANWRVASRLPIGTQKSIREWTVADMNKFFGEWYRLDKMTLFVVGNFNPAKNNEAGEKDSLLTMDAVEQKIKTFWGSKQLLPGQTTDNKLSNRDYGTPEPVSPVLLQEVDGINGMQFNLLQTRDFAAHPWTMNTYRHYFNGRVFLYSYGLQMVSALMHYYPSISADQFKERNAGVDMEQLYDFNSTISMFAALSPGKVSASSSWRQDLTIALGELKSLANEGPSSILTIALAFIVAAETATTAVYIDQQQLDNNAMLELLLGDGDPQKPYTGAMTEAYWAYSFISLGFLNSITSDIQAMAQFTYRGAVEPFYSKEENEKNNLYPHVKRIGQSSISVFVGRSVDGQTITVDDIAQAVRSAHETPYSSKSGGINMLSTSFDSSTQRLDRVILPSTLPAAPITGSSVLSENADFALYRYKLFNGITVNATRMRKKSSSQDKGTKDLPNKIKGFSSAVCL